MWLLIGVCALGMVTFATSAVVANVPAALRHSVRRHSCISLAIAFFWTFPIRMFQGAEAAAAIAVTSTLGNLGGIIGQNLMPNSCRLGRRSVPSPCGCPASAWVRF